MPESVASKFKDTATTYTTSVSGIKSQVDEKFKEAGEEEGQSKILLHPRLIGQVAESVTTEDYVVGDINGDGNVDVSDVNLAVLYILGKTQFTPEQFKRGDVNGDGVIDVTDVNGIVNIILGN